MVRRVSSVPVSAVVSFARGLNEGREENRGAPRIRARFRGSFRLKFLRKKIWAVGSTRINLWSVFSEVKFFTNVTGRALKPHPFNCLRLQIERTFCAKHHKKSANFHRPLRAYPLTSTSRSLPSVFQLTRAAGRPSVTCEGRALLTAHKMRADLCCFPPQPPQPHTPCPRTAGML